MNSSTADGDASLGEKVFNISVTEIESTVEPDRISKDIGREPLTLISIHSPVLTISAIKLAIPAGLYVYSHRDEAYRK